MSRDHRTSEFSRRTLILSAGTAAIIVPWALQTSLAAEPDTTSNSDDVAPYSAEFEEALQEILGGGEPEPGEITVDLPEIAENGNFVPLTIEVASPMTQADHIKSIYLLSTANPVARVAHFHLKPVNAEARVQSRMRLAKTQDVVVIAERSDGIKMMATIAVKVLIGGCGI